MQKIEIPMSKTRMYVMMAFAAFLIAIGIFIIIYTIVWPSRNPLLLTMLVVITIICIALGIFGIITSKKLFANKMGLIIDESGITDNSTALSVGLIPWHDIKGVTKYEMMSTKMMLINLHDTTKYLFFHTGFKREIVQKTMDIYNTPIAISAGTLDISFDDLQHHIERGWKHYKPN